MADNLNPAFKSAVDGEKRHLPVSAVVSATAQAMSIQFNNLVYELKQKGVRVIVLSLGEAFFEIPLFDLGDLPIPEIYHYTHSRGIPELRNKFAAYYRHRHGVPVEPATEMIITPGSKAAIYFTMLALLNPGDEVLLHEPAWLSYSDQVRFCHARPISLSHQCSVRDYEKYISSNSRLIVVNNPNNPQGRIFGREELRWIVDLAKANDLWVLADEAYSDFVIEKEDFCSIGQLDPAKANTIICNSASKQMGISGWRAGYCIASEEVISQVLKVTQHLVTCPASLVQFYLAIHFDELVKVTEPQVRKIMEKRRQVAAVLDQVGLRHLPGGATFYFFVSIAPSTLGSEEFCRRLLMEDYVCVVPGCGYGASCDQFVRVSIGTESVSDIEEGLRRLKRLIDKTSAAASRS